MRQRLKRVAMTLVITGVLVGGGSAIAHAATAQSFREGFVLGIELDLIELSGSVERSRHRYVPGHVDHDAQARGRGSRSWGPRPDALHCDTSGGGGGIRTRVLERPTGSSPGAARW